MSNNDSLEPETPSDETESSLQERVEILEGQVLNCLRFMRYQAEKEIKSLGIQTKPKAQA